MKNVYLLWHVHTIENSEADEKLIGVYTSETEAKNTIDRLKNRPGFVHRPEGFQIASYELGKDHWIDGYSTMTSIFARNLEPSDEQKYVGIAASIHPGDVYDVCSIDEGKKIEFGIGDFVKCEVYQIEPNETGLLAVKKIKNGL